MWEDRHSLTYPRPTSSLHFVWLVGVKSMARVQIMMEEKTLLAQISYMARLCGFSDTGEKKVPDNTGDYFILARLTVLRKVNITYHKP